MHYCVLLLEAYLLLKTKIGSRAKVNEAELLKQI